MPDLTRPMPMFLTPKGRKPRPAPPVSTWNGLNALANPSLAGWPDSTNTGVPAGTSLTNSGSVSSSSNSQIIQDLRISSGGIVVTHSNVTVRRCQITCDTFHALNGISSTNLTVQDCEIIGGVGDNLDGVQVGNGTTVQRCNIHGFENGLKCNADDVTIRDNYIHTFAAPGSPHYDGLELFGGSNYWVYHNTIVLDQSQTSAINLAPENVTNDGYLVESNLINGGGWTIGVDDADGPITNYRLINNRFGTTHAFGYSPLGWPNVTSGNVRDDTGANIDGDL